MMTSQSSEKENFSKFYENLMDQLDQLGLLVRIEQENNSESCETIINTLTTHHKDFYKMQWAHEDVLTFFNPVWLTPLKNACPWVTGWKSSIVFRLVESLKKTSLAEMTEEQVKKIEALRLNIKAEEGKVKMAMERQQMWITDRNIVELVRLESLAKENGGDSAAVSRVNSFVEVALTVLLDGLKDVMKRAHCVRLKTLKGVLDLSTPVQSVHFLAAMTSSFLSSYDQVSDSSEKIGKVRDNKSNPAV